MDHMSYLTQFLSFLTPQKPPAKPQPQETLVLVGSFSYARQVMSSTQDQAVLEVLFGPHAPHGVRRQATAWLIPEEENPHDKNAVRVEIRGKKVGYLHSRDAGLFRRQRAAREMPNAIGQCQAVVTGGWVSRDGRKGPFEVWLDLPSTYL
jgi:hypothetical protein